MKFARSYIRGYNKSILLASLTIVIVIAAVVTPSIATNHMSATTITKEVLAQPSTDNKTSATTENMSATPILGNPIFVEHDKITSQKQVNINGTSGLSVTFSGNGTLKGIDFTDVGSALIAFRPNGFGDLKGKAVITTTTANGNNSGSSNDTSGDEKATYTFYATGRQDASGIVKSSGATFFHTNSTTGKFASIDNLVVVFRNQVDKVGNDITIGWKFK